MAKQPSHDDLDHFVNEHMKDAQAAIVVDGSANAIIAQLLAAGWTWTDRPDVHCAGKRIRYLRRPSSPDSTTSSKTGNE